MYSPLDDAIRAIMARHPALPLDRLVGLLRDRGVAVTPALLVRQLSDGRTRAKLIDPWCGPQRDLLAELVPEGYSRGPWVVPDPDDPPPDPPPPARARLMADIRAVGRGVDDRSPRDLLRWMGLLEEWSEWDRAA